MVIRFDTTCPRCHKENSVFGYDQTCHDCQVKGYFKAQVRTYEKQKIFRKELQEMKPEIKEKLHAQILKEILEEND